MTTLALQMRSALKFLFEFGQFLKESSKVLNTSQVDLQIYQGTRSCLFKTFSDLHPTGRPFQIHKKNRNLLRRMWRIAIALRPSPSAAIASSSAPLAPPRTAASVEFGRRGVVVWAQHGRSTERQAWCRLLINDTFVWRGFTTHVWGGV